MRACATHEKLQFKLMRNYDGIGDFPPIGAANASKLVNWAVGDSDRFKFLLDCLPLCATERQNNGGVCDQLVEVATAAPDKKLVAERVGEKIFPMGYSGSLSAAIRRRAKIAESFLQLLDDNGKTLLSRKLVEAEARAVREARKEEQEQQLENARFE